MSETMDDLRTQAGELGIDVDKRWGKNRLKAEISQASPNDDPKPEETAKPKAAPASAPLVRVKLLRGYWPTKEEKAANGVSDDKMTTGEFLMVPKDRARELFDKRVVDPGDF